MLDTGNRTIALMIRLPIHATSIPSKPKKRPDGYRKETFLNLMDVYRENVMSCIRTSFGLNEKILQKKLEKVLF